VIKAAGLSKTDTNIDDATEDLLASLGTSSSSLQASPVRPSALGRVSPHIEDVLAVALAKEPRRRFPSARAFARAFVAARRGEPVEIDPPPYAWA